MFQRLASTESQLDAMDDPLGRILKDDVLDQIAEDIKKMQWTIRWVGY